MECVKCGAQAKWKSTKYPSPLCSKCAREEVELLLKTGNYNIEDGSLRDFYDFIDTEEKVLGSSFNIKSGRFVKLAKK